MAFSEIIENSFPDMGCMSDEQLRDILRADSERPEGEPSDTERVLYAMKLLAGRRTARGEAGDPARALEEFKAYYDPRRETAVPAARKSTVLRWKRALTAAAAAALLVSVGTLSAGASKFDLREPIARWTQNNFRWGTADTPAEINADIAVHNEPVQNVLKAYGITEKMVPSWIPEGYVQKEVAFSEQSNGRYWLATFSNGEEQIVLDIWMLNDPEAEGGLRVQSDWEVYQSGGCDYYIHYDGKSMSVQWLKGSCKGVIIGAFSRETACRIIDSIENG